jgi:mono/diheme cytochrome c family protein
MRSSLLILEALCFFALGMLGCAGAPGRPRPNEVPIVPGEVSDFGVLYGQNCAGCHGTDGKGGEAIALSNPVYLAIAGDAILRGATANGIPGTSMPAFAQSAGGMLTDKQVDLIAAGIRQHWSQPDVLRGSAPPPYTAQAPGDPARGSEVYGTFCSSCHGPNGRGGPKASSIVDGSFLALVSDQELRTVVIAGRPELGAPDWRNDVPGKPLTAQDISDAVAWLACQRPNFSVQSFPTSSKAMGEIQ